MEKALMKKAREWAEYEAEEAVCAYCIYNGCPGFGNNPDGPFYPPCSGGSYENLLDYNAIARDLQDGKI